MRQRRAAIDETRARIIDAAIELYESVGPAETTMSAVATRAGVTRATLYRHFASEEAVAQAVVGAWREAWPSLDTAALGRIADAAARQRATLAALYAGYRATDALTGNLARDSHALPAASRAAVREPAMTASRVLGSSVGADHAVAFETWRSLRDAGLADAAIADLMAKFIALAPAASTKGRAASSGRRASSAAAARPAAAAASSRRRAGSAGATSAAPTATSRRAGSNGATAATTGAGPCTTAPGGARRAKPSTGGGATATTTPRRRAAAPATASAPRSDSPVARRRTPTAPAAAAPPAAPVATPPPEPRAEKVKGKGKDKARKDKAGKKGKGDRKARG
jgi:AcrR family transcriptional regulator